MSIRFRFCLLLSAALLLPLSAQAYDRWLIATSAERVSAGEEFKLEVVRPDANAPWPATLRLKVVSDTTSGEVELKRDTGFGDEQNRQTYSAVLPPQFGGLLKIELAGATSNRLLLSAVSAENAGATSRRFDPMPSDESALSPFEPVYFVIGTRSGTNSRYQVSFKYRVFDAESTPAEWFPPLKKLHFAYTQTSFWDMSSSSMPFRDTSYRPSLFWQSRQDETNTMGPAYIRSGLEHESNGKDGALSRSINIVYLQPAWRKDFESGKSLFFAPRIYEYINQDGNPDLARYRGYADWQFRYGNEHVWMLTGRIRTGTAGFGNAQLDFSLPFRKALLARTGGFFYLQIFKGYGESLLDYNVRKPAQIRAGFSIIR